MADIRIINITPDLLVESTVDDVIDEMIYDPEDVWFEDCIEIINEDQFGKDVVVAPNVAYRLVADNLIAVEGDYCAYDEDTGVCEPDWSITLLYENVENDSDFDPNKWLYFEQGTICSAVHNFKRYMGE